MARRVARTVQNIEHVWTHGDLLAFDQPAVRRDVAQAAHAEHLALALQALQQHCIAPIRADDLHRSARGQQIAHLHGAAGMIEMTMGEP